MKVYASSDHHLYHRNIIKYANRPFDFDDENCVIDNAKLMIERHNEIVTDDDVHIFVGDLSAGLKGRYEHFKQMLGLFKGKKILVRGNHDHCPDEFYLDAGFVHVTDHFLIGEYFINHYPCIKHQWNKGPELKMIEILEKSNATKIIHGHVHNKNMDLVESNDNYKRFNMCVDYEPNDYYPQELTDPSIVAFFDRYK